MRHYSTSPVVFAVALGIVAPAWGQAPKDKPVFTPAQSTALDALYEMGGIIIQLDEKRPGRPVVLIDVGGHPGFKDDAVKHLLPFNELQVLRLANTPLTDAGVARLVALKKLRVLDLNGTHVTESVVASLREALPELKVSSSPPKLPPEEALAAIKKAGGLLVHYDDRRPGNPVIMIDATNHREFKDEWTGYFASFPSLKQIGLNGSTLTDAGLPALARVEGLESLHLAETRITDAGLMSLMACKNLTYLNVEGTRVTAAGVAALRRSLPNLEIADRMVKTGEPIPPPSAGATTMKKFTAAEIAKLRSELTKIGTLPPKTPDGWSKSKIDPAETLKAVPTLKLRSGNVLRAYVFKENGNSNGFVWALPADAAYPEPKDCPVVESHFLKPPKPFDALDDLMEAIEGDGSAESYLQASILKRELREFAAGGHGVRWGMHTILDASPWSGGPPKQDDPPHLRPRSKSETWKWYTDKPIDWKPQVRLETDRAVVTYYTYTPLAGERPGSAEELRERIIWHTETYRRGKYRSSTVEKILAEGPDAIAQ